MIHSRQNGCMSSPHRYNQRPNSFPSMNSLNSLGQNAFAQGFNNAGSFKGGRGQSAMLLPHMSQSVQQVQGNGQTLGEAGPEGVPPPPPGGFRQHTTIQSNGNPDLVPADTQPIANSLLNTTIVGDKRVLESNGISEHLTGSFPNNGNPNGISEQNYSYSVPLNPTLADTLTPSPHTFGIGLNGVPFDPGAGEFYKGDPSLGWQYEALSGAVALGLDENHAHVQPTGAYHYHGLPDMLLENLGVSPDQHSPQVGWALDGFPIYSLYGYQDPNDMSSPIVELESSYQLRLGQRPSDGDNPGGVYDGTFTADYEYVAGSGDLDAANGRFVKTPEFPEGTYAYFLTDSYPVIPRFFSGTPATNDNFQPPM